MRHWIHDDTADDRSTWLIDRRSSRRSVHFQLAFLHDNEFILRGVRRFVAPLYKNQPEPEPIVRYEAAPGHQIQMDWSEHRLDRHKIYCFVGLLGYSRQLYIEYVDSMKSEMLIACHERMLAAFGGVPNEILYDNMRTVVCARDAYGRAKHRFQTDLLELSRRHGFLPRLCGVSPIL